MSPTLIDVHSHALLPAYRHALVEASGAVSGDLVDGLPLPDWSPAQHIETMDRAGIDVCILSMPDSARAVSGDQSMKLARSLNTELAKLVAAHPTRFGGFATIPMDDMDAALDELAYALDVLKFDGALAPTHHRGRYLGEGAFDPLLKELDRRGATLFVHPTAPPGFDVDESRLNVSALEYMFESTRMIATMIMSGAKQRFHRINIISTHGGGTIPYLAHRIGLISQMPWAYRGGPKLDIDEMKDLFASFYYDLTASTSSIALEALRRLVPPERLLLGFDWPLMPAQTIAPAFQAFAGSSILTSAEKNRISSLAALELFPRFRQPATQS